MLSLNAPRESAWTWTTTIAEKGSFMTEEAPTESFGALVIHTCGHQVAYRRDNPEALKYVTDYARTTLCWPCWKAKHRPGSG
jgi:hypothetical protein